MIPSKEKIEQYLEILQCIMRIQDWDIKIKMLTSGEMQKETGDMDNLAECRPDMKNNRAEILFNKEDKMHEDDKEWYDTLVHELKHIQQRPLYDQVMHLFSYIDMPQNHKDALKNQVTANFEQNTTAQTREFCSIYPIESLIEESEEGDENV